MEVAAAAGLAIGTCTSEMAPIPDQQAHRTRLGVVFDLCGILSALIFGAIAVLVAVDIATRTFRLTNLTWSNEVCEYLLTFGTFIGAPWVLHHHGHVNIDLVVSNLPERARRLMTRLCDGLGLIISVILFYESARILVDTYRSGSLVFKNLIFPEWYLTIPPVLCFLLCAVELASRFMRPPGVQP